MRYIVKDIKDYPKNSPEWFYYYKQGGSLRWSVYDSEIGATLVSFRTEGEAKATAALYEETADEDEG